MEPLAEKMCLIKYHIWIFCLIILNCYALNCRSEGGPKEAELKKVYTKCLKSQEGKNSSISGGYSGHQDWKETRGHSQKYDWEREQMGRNNDRIRGSNDATGRKDDRMSSRDDDTRNRDSTMGGRNNLQRDDQLSGRSEFQSDEIRSDMPHQYGSYPSSRRYKREKERRTENYGQRSQFNPNSSKKSAGCGDTGDPQRKDDMHSGENSSTNDADNKACAFHCFLEHLEMTGDNGMPDRYMVTHALTKDVANEDLKDFLQESIEECFQILDNENIEDKCEFSKKILMCLSEKGRANCDDWKDELRF